MDSFDNAEEYSLQNIQITNTTPNSEIHQHTDLHSQFMSSLNNMRSRHMFTDVILCAGHEEFPCHKAILVASSPYFEAMFRPPFDEERHGRVSIQEISPWTVKRILDYIYTGTIELTQSNVEDLLGAASRLQYPKLVHSCTAFMLKQLDVSNCLGMELLAHFYGLHQSAKVARQFAEENFSRVVEESSEWLNLSFDDVVRYLQRDEIDVKSEEIVYNSVIRWTLHEIEKRSPFLLQLLQFVRLPHLSDNFLKKQVQENKLIKDSPSCVELLQQAIAIRRSVHENSTEQSSQMSSTLVEDDNSSESKGSPCPPSPAGSDVVVVTSSFNVTQPTHYSCPPPRPSTFKRSMLVALGGINTYILNSVEVYDPRKGQWINNLVPQMPTSCTWSAICALDNNVYVTGGIRDGTIDNQVYQFSTERCTWIRCAPLPIPRARHTAVAANGMLFVFGGVTTINSLTTNTTASNLHDVGSGSSSYEETVSPSLMPAYHHHSNMVTGIAEIHGYDPIKDEWFSAGMATNPRKESVIVAVNDPDYMVSMKDSIGSRERSDSNSSSSSSTTGDKKSIHKKRRDKLSSLTNGSCDRLTLIEIGGEPVEVRTPPFTSSQRSGEESMYDSSLSVTSQSARHASWEAHIHQQQQQMAIYRIQQADRTVLPTQDYILLPKRIHHAKCVTRQMGTMLYILWEDSGDFAVLNLTRNSIVFLSPLMSPCNELSQTVTTTIANAGGSTSTSSGSGGAGGGGNSTLPRRGGGLLHCGMACVQDHIYVAGGCRDPAWHVDSMGSHSSANVWCFDPQSNSWTKLDVGLSQPRGILTCVALNL